MTATIENYVHRFLGLAQANSNTKFCDDWNEFLEEKI